MSCSRSGPKGCTTTLCRRSSEATVMGARAHARGLRVLVLARCSTARGVVTGSAPGPSGADFSRFGAHLRTFSRFQIIAKEKRPSGFLLFILHTRAPLRYYTRVVFSRTTYTHVVLQRMWPPPRRANASARRMTRRLLAAYAQTCSRLRIRVFFA